MYQQLFKKFTNPSISIFFVLTFVTRRPIEIFVAFTNVRCNAFASGAAALRAVGRAGVIHSKVALAALANDSALCHVLKRENMNENGW